MSVRFSSSPPSVLRRVVLDAQRTTGLPVVFAGPVGRHGVLLCESVGMRTKALDGLLVRHNHGLGGYAVQVRRPVAVRDYRASRCISHDYDRQVGMEGLVSLAAVPIFVRQQPCAVLFGAVRGPVALGGRAIDTLMRSANALGKQLDISDISDPANWQFGRSSSFPCIDRDEFESLLADLRHLAAQLENGPREQILKICVSCNTVSSALAFTAREVEIMMLVAAGYTNRRIAVALGTREPAVKAQLRRAMRKLDVSSRHAAVSAARTAGILP